MPAGRPPYPWPPELEAQICAALAEGSSLRTICALESMPSAPTIFKHLAESKEFAEQYARAREMQMEAMAEEILQIADDGLNDTYETEEGEQRTNQDVIQRSRLRVDTRKWLMSKMAPKKYGDKIQTEVSGPNGGPMQVQDITELTDAQLAAIAAGEK